VFGSFSETEVNLFTERLQTMDIQKNDTLLEIGEVCQAIYFVVSGSFRQYHTNSEYVDINKLLYIENNWVLEHKSFTGQKPSDNKIQAFEDSKVLKISMDDIHELIGLSPSFFKLGKILEIVADNKYQQNNLISPEAKYLTLLEECPRLLQIFPLKHIASYLGITPETLSRVRKKISN